eukprot:7017177-Prymnesium_polylepis.1
MPKNQAVPLWGANLIAKLHKDGYSRANIAGIIGYHHSTVKAILRFQREQGQLRTAAPGKNKVSDSRWIFAGATGFHALAELEALKERLEDDELLLDVHRAFVAEGTYSPAYRTLCNALQKELEYTAKRASPRPALRARIHPGLSGTPH